VPALQAETADMMKLAAAVAAPVSAALIVGEPSSLLF